MTTWTFKLREKHGLDIPDETIHAPELEEAITILRQKLAVVHELTPPMYEIISVRRSKADVFTTNNN